MSLPDLQLWNQRFERLTQSIRPCFVRTEAHQRAISYIKALLQNVQRKNSWQLAQEAGLNTPHAFQRLLGRGSWDADALRDILRNQVLATLTQQDVNHQEDQGYVLVLDETGFLKKGNKSAGVHRQYSGTAGRIENCQIGVFMAIASDRGQALIDRELYLPKAWCEDRDRMNQAGVPETISFKTKPQLACDMLSRALDAGLHPQWVLGDAVYGSDYKTRSFLESRGQAYVLGITSNKRLWVNMKQLRVDEIAGAWDESQWYRLCIAHGSKGPREYEFSGYPIGIPVEHKRGHLQKWLMVRRTVDQRDGALSYYLCAAPVGSDLEDLAKASAKRWSVEVCFEQSKQEAGLDEYEVRSWIGWYRHVSLSMLASGFLTMLSVCESESESEGIKKSEASDCVDGV